MPKYWIDSDGRQRLGHDENYQMVSSGVWSEDVALQMDSWDIERACKMIVLGYNENTKTAIEYGLKHCAEGSTGRDRAHALITIMNRVLTLAKSAIAIGILKETDTPKNWIAWAQSKGYKTDHINPLSIDDMLNESIYIRRVNNLHDTLGLKDKLDEFKTVRNIFDAVSSKNTELWGKNFKTFEREFWQPYKKETGYKRRKESGQ